MVGTPSSPSLSFQNSQMWVLDENSRELPLTRQDGVRGIPFFRLLYKVKKSVVTFPAGVDLVTY
jgi:hypothetical protein